MNAVRFRMINILMFILTNVWVIADRTALAAPSVTVIISKDKESEYRLEARQAPLALALADLAKKTGMRINYSVLPEGLVTSTCVGSTVEHILECLLARKADLVFRYPQTPAKTRARIQPAEAWILGAKYTIGQAPDDNACLSGQARQPAKQQTPDQEPEVDRTGELLKKAKSNDPAERATAVGELLSQGRPGDKDVREALETALTDKDANVRAQAISSYANREGDKAFAALQEALHDNDAWVRQMAVGSTDDKTLLQQAANDGEESVRSLALQKLNSLQGQRGSGQ